MKKLFILGDPTGCHTYYGINVLKVKPENIVVFEPTEWSRDLIAILDKNITTVSSTDSIPNMKFTHSLINPPYQAEGQKNAGKTQWDKFIPVVENVVVDGGWMNHVHPSAWRKPGHTLNRLFEYQFHKLSIHSDTEGVKTFGAGTRYDYYCIEKVSAYKNSLVRWQGEKDYVEFDLRGRDFLPNNEIELWDLVSFFSRENEVPSDLYMKATRSGHLNPGNKNLVDYVTDYPILHKLNAKGEKTIAYSAIPHPKNQFDKKVMFSETRHIFAIYDDGGMGCSDHMTWINVNSKEEGEVIVHFINSDIGKRLVKSSKWGNFRTEQVMWRKIVNPFKVGVRVGDTDDEIIQKYNDYKNEVLK